MKVKEILGKKWNELNEEVKEALLNQISNDNQGIDKNKTTEIIIDFENLLSINGKYVCNEYECVYEVDEDSEIYSGVDLTDEELESEIK